MTLNKAWEKTMLMWRWIGSRLDNSDKRGVITLKMEWIMENDPGFDGDDWCYFCAYAVDKAGEEIPPVCKFCPGRLISPKFDCQAKTYHYYYKPKKFLAKLEELNAKRLSNK